MVVLVVLSAKMYLIFCLQCTINKHIRHSFLIIQYMELKQKPVMGHIKIHTMAFLYTSYGTNSYVISHFTT